MFVELASEDEPEVQHGLMCAKIGIAQRFLLERRDSS